MTVIQPVRVTVHSVVEIEFKIIPGCIIYPQNLPQHPAPRRTKQGAKIEVKASKSHLSLAKTELSSNAFCAPENFSLEARTNSFSAPSLPSPSPVPPSPAPLAFPALRCSSSLETFSRPINQSRERAPVRSAPVLLTTVRVGPALFCLLSVWVLLCVFRAGTDRCRVGAYTLPAASVRCLSSLCARLRWHVTHACFSSWNLSWNTPPPCCARSLAFSACSMNSPCRITQE